MPVCVHAELSLAPFVRKGKDGGFTAPRTADANAKAAQRVEAEQPPSFRLEPEKEIRDAVIRSRAAVAAAAEKLKMQETAGVSVGVGVDIATTPALLRLKEPSLTDGMQASPTGVDLLRSVDKAVEKAVVTGPSARLDNSAEPEQAAATAATAAGSSKEAPSIVPSLTACAIEDTAYHLSAILRHHGSCPGSGHYTADVRGRRFSRSASDSGSWKTAEPESEYEWTHFDDNHVRKVSAENILSDQSSPYLLFYERPAGMA